jgi:hypothetical protein
MELTIFMTVEQANSFRRHNPFSSKLYDNATYAHYLKYSLGDQSWHWDGWDRLDSITRNQPQLTYEEFISIPTPITLTKLKNHFPELFI